MKTTTEVYATIVTKTRSLSRGGHFISFIYDLTVPDNEWVKIFGLPMLRRV